MTKMRTLPEDTRASNVAFEASGEMTTRDSRLTASLPSVGATTVARPVDRLMSCS